MESEAAKSISLPAVSRAYRGSSGVVVGTVERRNRGIAKDAAIPSARRAHKTRRGVLRLLAFGDKAFEGFDFFMGFIPLLHIDNGHADCCGNHADQKCTYDNDWELVRLVAYFGWGGGRLRFRRDGF
jgi:hypothetical protein